MDSLLKPGKLIEVGSTEWQAYMIHKIEENRKTIEGLQKMISVLEEYRRALMIQYEKGDR